MIRLELDITEGRGRVPSARDRACPTDLKAAPSSQRPRRLKPPVSVRLAASGFGARSGDACGDAADFGRCLLATLSAHGLSDGLLRRLTVEWVADGPGEGAEDGPGERAENGPGCVVLVQPEVAA